MQRSLKDHISQLEQLIKTLDDQLVQPDLSEAERLRFTAEIRTAQQKIEQQGCP